jgi:hypothetical protein
MWLTDEWLAQFSEWQAKAVLDAFRALGFKVYYELPRCAYRIST